MPPKTKVYIGNINILEENKIRGKIWTYWTYSLMGVFIIYIYLKLI